MQIIVLDRKLRTNAKIDEFILVLNQYFVYSIQNPIKLEGIFMQCELVENTVVIHRRVRATQWFAGIDVSKQEC